LEGHNSKALDIVSGIFEGCGFTTYLSQLKLGQYSNTILLNSFEVLRVVRPYVNGALAYEKSGEC
jgi:hypothetical protein